MTEAPGFLPVPLSAFNGDYAFINAPAAGSAGLDTDAMAACGCILIFTMTAWELVDNRKPVQWLLPDVAQLRLAWKLAGPLPAALMLLLLASVIRQPCWGWAAVLRPQAGGKRMRGCTAGWAWGWHWHA